MLLTNVCRLVLVLPGLLLFLVGTGCAGAEPKWDPEHRALWTSNAAGQAGRRPGRGTGRGPSKRHARLYAGQSSWVPGSKMPLYHYPGGEGGRGHDQSLQYMEGAHTVLSPRRVAPPAPLGAPRTPGRAPAAQRRRGDSRRLRHQKHQPEKPSQDSSPRDGLSISPSSTGRQTSRNVTMLRTVQRGSALVPLVPLGVPGPVPVQPVFPDPNKTQRTLVQFVVPDADAAPEPANLMDPSTTHVTRDAARFEPQTLNPTAVPTCPTDRTVLAPKGQDYVLMAKISAKDGTPMDVVAGPQAGDPVSEGPHPVVGRLVPSVTATARRPQQAPLCRLTYTVVVRHCGPPPTLSAPSGMTARSPRCTAGTAWGSRCHYRCPRRDLTLRGNSWIQCDDDLHWNGRAPVCTGRSVAGSLQTAPRRSCPVLLAEHGQVSCRAQDGDAANDALTLAEGSECTVSCKPPHHLQLDESAGPAPERVVTRCGAGRWNVTSWRCVRGKALDTDMGGDIPAVLSDAGSAVADTWSWRDNSVTDPCSPNPCLSGGVCLRGPPAAASAPLCQCKPGTEGERCERVLCRGACLHGGRCVVLRGQHSCFCRRGYAGSRCQAPVKDVRFPAPTPAAAPWTVTPSPTSASPTSAAPVNTTSNPSGA